MIVHCLHPGPVRHRPPRGRLPRTSFVPVTTPARLRELVLSDTDPGPRFQTAGHRTIETRRLDGGLWQIVGQDAPGEKGRRRHPDARAFAGWLAGHAEHRDLDRTDVARAFAGTPLVARPFDRNILARAYEPVADSRLGAVFDDHRAGASRAVADLFERDVALVSGVPMVRMRGPVAYFDRRATLRVARFPGAWTQEPGQDDGLFYRLDRARVPHGYGPTGTLMYDWGRIGDASAWRDDDVALSVAHAIHRVAWALVHAGWPNPRPEWAGGEAGEELREGIMRLVGPASVGLIGDEVLPGAVDLATRGCLLMARSGSDRPGNIERCHGYLVRHAGPAMAARAPLDGPDVDALGALAP